MIETDVAILGAGPVGLTLARKLAGSRFRVTLIERRTLAAQSNDPRALALAHGARQLLEPLGVWPEQTTTAIENIHVSQRGGFGRCLLHAADYRLPALGYVVRYGDLSATLARNIAELPGITLLENATTDSAEIDADSLTLSVEQAGQKRSLRARLLVHAEGTPDDESQTTTLDYQQHAVIAEVQCAGGHAHRAWERFTPDGPLALLPYGQGYAVVFTVPGSRAAALLALDDQAFLAALQAQFGRQIELTASSPRAAFPLALRLRRNTIAARQVWIGNAAQTLHPVSGQGFNLGLRDAEVLGEALWRGGPDVGASQNLAGYARRRRLDRYGGATFTDGIVRLFSNDLPPLKLARGLGLCALDIFPPARHFVASRMIWGARAWP